MSFGKEKYYYFLILSAFLPSAARGRGGGFLYIFLVLLLEAKLGKQQLSSHFLSIFLSHVSHPRYHTYLIRSPARFPVLRFYSCVPNLRINLLIIYL